MREDKALAAILAEGEFEDAPPSMGDGDADYSPEELDEEADEGQMVACEEILQAFEERDSRALLSALRSFIRMAN